MKQLGEFNRKGVINAQELKNAEVGETGLEGRVRLGDEVPSDDDVETAALNLSSAGEPASEAASAAEDNAEGETAHDANDTNDTNDANGDGHDDETGEFVEGNQEAANPAGDEVA